MNIEHPQNGGHCAIGVRDDATDAPKKKGKAKAAPVGTDKPAEAPKQEGN